MKRALAERAKQQTDEQNRNLAQCQMLTASISSDGIQVPPRKKMLRETSPSQTQTASPVPSSVEKVPMPSSDNIETKPLPQTHADNEQSTSSKPINQKKRIRPGPRSIHNKPLNLNTNLLSDEEESNTNSNAFYLKHQNRALACELYNYKHKVIRLEEERSIRRQECREIANTLGQIESCWRKMEVTLLGGLNDWKTVQLNKTLSEPKQIINDFVDDSICTGAGKDVEYTSHLINSLSKVVRSPFLSSLSEIQIPTHNDCYEDHNGENVEENRLSIDGSISQEEKTFLNALSNATSSFAKRCSNFQQLVLDLVSHLWSNSVVETNGDEASISRSKVFQVSKLHEQIATLQHTQSEMQKKMDEIAAARDYSNASEHRIRRGLYRVANGRMKIEEVLKAVEEYGSSPTDSHKLEEVVSNDVKKNEEEEKPEVEEKDIGKSIIVDGEIFLGSDITKLKNEIKDIETIASSREKQVFELLRDKDSLERRINELMMPSEGDEMKPKLDDDTIRQSLLFVEVSTKLRNSERECSDLKSQIKTLCDRWATTKGDLESSKKSIIDIEEKYQRRLSEIASASTTNIDSVADSSFAVDTNNDNHHLDYARKMAEMENKLRHALESVRQSEAFRISLSEANMANQILKGKLEELKEDTSRAADTDRSASPSSLLDSSETSDELSDEQSLSLLKERMRRMKKELSVALSGRDQIKKKQERAEYQRDELMNVNERLSKRCTEKDEMEKKSITTILHLKQLAEKVEQERNLLEKKLKGSEQLGLAARLTLKAKEKVEEEALREKEVIEEELNNTKTRMESLKEEKNDIEIALEKSKCQLKTSYQDLGSIRSRCDELTTALSSSEQEKKDLYEALAIAKKDAKIASEKATMLETGTNGTKGRTKSEFTVEELETHLNVLKGRLTCAVCNLRDKQVILSRCRHMFCRQCVDKNIKNRSRKCPACGQRFDVKEVEDIWL